MHSNNHASSTLFLPDGIYFAIIPLCEWNLRGIPFIFEMQVEICPCGFLYFVEEKKPSGITAGTGLAASEAASKMNGRGLSAGHDCRWSSRPQCPVECRLTVRNATTSEPVELAALACGCAGEEPKTAVEISRQLALQVWVDAAGPQGCAKPTRNLGLPQLQLIKTGSPTPSQTQTILHRWSWRREMQIINVFIAKTCPVKTLICIPYITRAIKVHFIFIGCVYLPWFGLFFIFAIPFGCLAII